MQYPEVYGKFLNDPSSAVSDKGVEDFARETLLKSFDCSPVRCKMVLPNQHRTRTETAVSVKNVFG